MWLAMMRRMAVGTHRRMAVGTHRVRGILLPHRNAAQMTPTTLAPLSRDVSRTGTGGLHRTNVDRQSTIGGGDRRVFIVDGGKDISGNNSWVPSAVLEEKALVRVSGFLKGVGGLE